MNFATHYSSDLGVTPRSNQCCCEPATHQERSWRMGTASDWGGMEMVMDAPPVCVERVNAKIVGGGEAASDYPHPRLDRRLDRRRREGRRKGNLLRFSVPEEAMMTAPSRLRNMQPYFRGIVSPSEATRHPSESVASEVPPSFIARSS
ncbi:hypothetical protein ACHAWF_014108 [Thalassiosira exigua]